MAKRDIIFLQIVLPLAILILTPSHYKCFAAFVSYLSNFLMSLYIIENDREDKRKTISVVISTVSVIVSQLVITISGIHCFKEFDIFYLIVHLGIMFLDAIMYSYLFGVYTYRRK